MLKDGYERPD